MTVGRLRLRLITTAIVALLAAPQCSSSSCAAELAVEHATQIEQIISSLMKTHGVPGLSIAVGKDNELVYASGFGEADLENSVPATADTRYRTASIAKPMTAAIVLALAEENRLDLDKDVRQYVPEFSRKRWPVTSRQLLGHLGGVRHYRTSAESSSTAHYFTLKSALATFADDPLIHQPGTKYRYSSFSYNLLGSVAEGASGKTFPELLRTRVLSPASMTHTAVDDQYAVIPDRSRGYIRATVNLLKQLPTDHNLVEGQLYNATLHDTSMKIPGGGLLSTAPDLVRFANAVNSVGLHITLPPPGKKRDHSSSRPAPGAGAGAGNSW